MKKQIRNPARKRRAFTLVEVLICMALFAVGFASIAIILPSGVMMQKSVEGDINGGICGRNALEVMKGKGMHALTYQIITAPSALTSINRRGGATGDMERQRVAQRHHTMFTSSSPALAEYWNTNGDTRIYKEANPLPPSPPPRGGSPNCPSSNGLTWPTRRTTPTGAWAASMS